MRLYLDSEQFSLTGSDTSPLNHPPVRIFDSTHNVHSTLQSHICSYIAAHVEASVINNTHYAAV